METGEGFVCEVCGNSDPKMIGYLNGKAYCRRCISFKGENVDNFAHFPQKAEFSLSYNLSDEQNVLSLKLVENYKKSINSLVHAVCGAGKTEIVLRVIKYAIECGDKVGFAVPRRDVAIELCDRFASIFTKNKITLVYGGHHNCLEGDLVCLTTHQLFRYKKYFDLLILDEVDAFPFKDNEILNAFFEDSIKGNYIMMSATPDENLIQKFQGPNKSILELFTRFHGHPLPVPKIICRNKPRIYLELVIQLKRFSKDRKQVFIFTPTIDLCETTSLFLKAFFKEITCVHSKKEDRSQIIQDFRDKKYQFLVTTAVLERGVTVKDLQVIVFMADSRIYNRYSLVQIAGRVGRKKDAPEGEVIFLVQEVNEEVQRAREDIESANKNLQTVF